MSHTLRLRKSVKNGFSIALSTLGITFLLFTLYYFSLSTPNKHDGVPSDISGTNGHRLPAAADDTNTHTTGPAKVGSDVTAQSRLSETFGRLPLRFEANEGQADARAHFISRGNGYTLFLSPSEAALSLSRANKAAPEKDILTSRSADYSEAESHDAFVRMSIIGGNPDASLQGVGEMLGKSNYFVGDDPRKWRTGVTNYARVKYTGVYPGVDLVYYGNQRQVEYDFVVAPGADPSDIKLGFDGIEALSVDDAGDLVLKSGGAEIRQHRPVIYQEADGGRAIVSGRYLLTGSHQVAFEISNYDKSKPLVIDPVLVYSTYLGGLSDDTPAGIAVDDTGAVYVAGRTTSADFPVTPGAYQTQRSAYVDIFVTKLNPAGTEIVYSTYIGGSGYDSTTDIAIDKHGSAYVTAEVDSSDFPTTLGALQPSYNGSQNGSVTKLSPDGSSLIYSTYLGGTAQDFSSAIAVDDSGCAYVVGGTFSSDFPTRNAFQPYNSSLEDAYLTKLSPDGSSLVYSTYFGGWSYDLFRVVAVDSDGYAYVAGNGNSEIGLPLKNEAQSHPAGINDTLVAKFTPDGRDIVYSTYIGGAKNDIPYSIAADSQGNAYVTGETSSFDFPVTQGAFQTAKGAGDREDAFVVKVGPQGGPLVFSTYLGGSGPDLGAAIAVDAVGDAYLAVTTVSTDFPHAGELTPPSAGNNNLFVSKLNAAGSSLLFSVLAGHDVSAGGWGGGIALQPSAGVNHIYVAGSFYSQSTQSQGFIAKLSDQLGTDLSISQSAGPNPVAPDAPLTFTLTVTNNGPGIAQGVTVSDDLPASTQFVSCAASGGGVCGGTDNHRTVAFASIPAGASATVTLVVVVHSSVSGGTIISNTAVVSSLVPELTPDDNTATAILTVKNDDPIPTVLVVNSATDTDDGACTAANCTLREAIKAANAFPDVNTINIALPFGSEIDLTGPLPDLSTSMTIKGTGAYFLTVRRNGGGNYRIFTVAGAGDQTVNISGMQITNGFAVPAGGGIYQANGSLNLTDMQVQVNQSYVGAGIYKEAGTLTVVGSLIGSNTSSFSGFPIGGGVHNHSGLLVIRNSTVTSNVGTGGEGGGIYNADRMEITGSLIHENAGRYGGGIYNGATGLLTMANTTVNHNGAGESGAGVQNDGLLTMVNCTLTRNHTNTYGGGLYRSGGTVNLINTIVAGNTSPNGPDVAGVVNGEGVGWGHNLIGDGADSSGLTNGVDGNQVGTGLNPIDPHIDALGAYGGPAYTNGLQPVSTAVDAGDSCVFDDSCLSTLGFALTTDQRGLPRKVDGNFDGVAVVDIGAYELNAPSHLQFDAAAYTVSEVGGSVTLTVTRTGGNDVACSVQYSTTNGTATPGAENDYVAQGPTTLHWPAGDSTPKEITIPINDDLIYEGVEQFTVTLSNPTGGASVAEPGNVPVTIVENDPAPVFGFQSLGQDEGNAVSSNFGIFVTRTGNTAVTATLDYQTIPGTATPGSSCSEPGVDYETTSGTLTFAPQETSRLVRIVVCGGREPEPDETFRIPFVNPVNGVILPGTGTSNITIANDDNFAPTVTALTGSYVYDGTGHPASGSATGNGGVILSPAVTFSYRGTGGTAYPASAIPPSAAGTYQVVANFAGNGNYASASSTPVPYTIYKATSSVTVSCPAQQVYTGAGINTCTASYSGAGGLTGTITPTYTDNVNVGAATASASYGGDGNHEASSGSATFTITPRAAAATADPKTNTYGDADPTFTYTPTGLLGTDMLTGVTCSVAGAHTAAGSYSIACSGNTNPNYSVSYVAGTLTINPKAVTVRADAKSKNYGDADPSLTYTGTLNLGDSFTGGLARAAGEDVGAYAIIQNNLSAGANYTITFVGADLTINKANATITVSGYTGTYDGAAHGATGTATGVRGVDLSSNLNLGSTFTNVPGGTVSWDFRGGRNYHDQGGTATIVITTASPNCGVRGYVGQYDGAPHGASGSCSGVGGPSDVLGGLDLGATFTLVPGGTANWTFTDTTGNYNGTSGSVLIAIGTVYCFEGFHSPIGGSVETGDGGSFANPLRSFKLGSTIPIKFTLHPANNCQGTSIVSGIHTFQAIRYSTSTHSEPPIDATPTDAATTGNQFRLTDNQWHYNLDTKPWPTNGFGTWLLVATLQDGSVHTVWITIKK